MIDAIYLAPNDDTAPVVVERTTIELEQSGLIHSKVAGKFEIVKELPKKADSLYNMFSNADVYGKLKVAYIDSAHKISSEPNKVEKHATAFGAELGFNTAAYNGFYLHATAYLSQAVSFLNPSKDSLNEDFFSKDVDSFAYIAEGSINYSYANYSARLGRIKIETPYANSDDIRMAPNTFEGACIDIEYTSKLKSKMIFVNRWAGYDSQDEDGGLFQDEFKDLVSEDSFGMTGVSLTYEYAKNSEAIFWYNYIDKMSAIAYGEVVGIYFIEGDGFHFDYGIQVSNIKELNNSNIAGTVLGAMSILHYKGLFFGGAYNVAIVDDGESITDGFGGGPYYTSLDEATITAISEAAPGDKAQAYRIGGGYEFENIGLDGLVVELVYGKLYNKNGHIKEKDAILTYEMNDSLNLETTYTKYKSSCSKNSFDRVLVRLEYNF